MSAQEDFVVEAFTLLALAVLFIILRVVSRWIITGPKNFQVDDYLMPLAAVVYGFETGAAYCVGAWWHGLANNAMTDAERKALSLTPESPEFALRVGGSKTQVIGWSLYTSLLWLLKACMAVFYSRLTIGLVNMRRRIHIAYIMIGVTYIAVICSILFGCFPMHKNWQIYPDPGNYCQPAVSHIDVYVTVVLNVVTDIYLISIPLPVLFKARLPIREKCELLLMFSGGIFVMTAGILRCVLIVTAGADGAQQAGSWACRETFVAVIIGNLPMVYPLIRRGLRRAGLVMSSHGPSSYGRNYELSGAPGAFSSTAYSGKKKRFRHPLGVGESNWQTISGEERLVGAKGPDGPYDGRGIKVVNETIVERD
ncbi:uncharacterized protein BDW47DRAFT_21647 [Aspergillus candidus]|uniref:Rhodopsin domain-containing protein n=1 Tax=Aspergillus candidus TaxID=41067 RepID=A0A2I2FDD8_ASPCN|nr:hypothetical protein BDW47DRAFT_21647 [Aspergillus candidus]PLB38619.1 hypothetical protein BDW47DRAFT_21647 [Aspergillus candidus]